MNENIFRNIILEMIEESPFAIRAVLKILSVEFTTEVRTLSVTREVNPRLLVNLDFINQNCETEKEVKAVICHEFLHILLRHTEKKGLLSSAEHLAMDAVINAIIHRELGEEYSSMMSRYYAGVQGIKKLLRPMNDDELKCYREHRKNPKWTSAWLGLYDGKLVVDDIKELAEGFTRPSDYREMMIFSILIGNHQDFGEPLSAALEDALNRSLKSMNGHGIWRSPKSRGVGANTYSAIFDETQIKVDRWKQSTLKTLKNHLQPDPKGRRLEPTSLEYCLPVLSTQDRRAFIRTLWSPFIPEASWKTTHLRSGGLAQVYLDVSGSMHAEMPFIIALLNQLRSYIKMPFWAFSDEIAPARIEAGQLITRTSGGTSLLSVLSHLAKTQPIAAVIVTDGYIEEIEPDDVLRVKHIKIHALVSRDGNPKLLEKAGIAYTQLERLPDDDTN